MKPKSKTKKAIIKLSIAIISLIIVVLSLFLFSEKVNKIEIVDNVKNILTGQTTNLIGENLNENKNDNSSNKIIDNIIDQNDDLHTQEECINEKIILREQNNQENFISTYSDKESKSEVIQGTDFPLINKYGITVDPSGNNSYGSIGTDGNLKNNMGTITNNVGEKGYVKSLQTRKYTCPRCKNILIENIPDDYAVITATIENSDIVNIIGYDVAEEYNEEYPYPCLQTIYDCKHPGSTTVEIEHYVNFNIPTTKGSCIFCGNYFIIKADHTWHKYKDIFNVTVRANYKLEYKSDDKNVTHIPESETKIVAETSSEFIISSEILSREGYYFLGWSEKENDNEVMYDPRDKITLNWSEGFGSTENPVCKTLYPVWEKKDNTAEFYIEYYYDNIIDKTKTEKDIRSYGCKILEDSIKHKIVANTKENYTYNSIVNTPLIVGRYKDNTIKVFYTSKKDEEENKDKLYTITVENNNSGHTYNSYQIFQGDYYEKEEKIIDENNVEQTKKVPILTNIEWGTELQKEITTDIEDNKGKTHGDKIIEILKSQNKELYKDCITAEDVAYVLQGRENDGDIIREFTNVVGKYLLDNNIEITKGTSEFLEHTDANTGKITDKNYKIDKLKPGYYIVIDAETKEKDDAYSRYLIDVVQDVTMEVKSSTPNLSKKVLTGNVKQKVYNEVVNEETEKLETTITYVENEKINTATYKEKSENYNAEDYDIKFELKSYIPETDSYSNYKFKVVDILAKGFDLDTSSIKVMLGENEYPKTREKVIKGNPETGEQDRTETVENYTITPIVINADNYETYKSYFEEEGQEYTEGYAQSNYGKTIILLELQDLVGQMSDNFVTKGQDIFIKYNAKLNGTGEVGNTPNINEAYLQYSNNPYNANETTQTTTQITYTYTIDLNLSKIAEIKDEVLEPTYLAGAEFEIYNGPEYIKEEGSLIPSKNPNRKLIATIKTDEILDSEGNIINEAGHAMYKSLSAGTYYIKETKSPEGYNKLKEEIQLEIKATCDELGAITWEIEPVANKLVLVEIEVKEIAEEKVNEETGETVVEVVKRVPEVKLQVENTSGFQLPATGGIGTIIFTVAGLSLMVLAVVLLKSNKKESK